MASPIWTPSQDRIEASQLYNFKGYAARRVGRDFPDYPSLWDWSVEDKEGFWDAVWDYCGVIGEKGERIFDGNGGPMFGSKFFPDGKINYAENLLQFDGAGAAMIFRDERGAERSLSRDELRVQVAKWQKALRDLGVVEGDRVAGYMPNMPETIIAALAAISLGAIWSSASPDFGAQGVIDRFGQIEPKVLVTVDGYYYNGKVIDVLDNVKDVQPQLKALLKTVVVPFAGSSVDVSSLCDTVPADDFIDGYADAPLEFVRVAFNHPLFIMFSSGTTGVPKCIVHGHGGTLLQHLKEHKLHCDVKPDDKVFYFTTCGWMMWNWLISALSCNATLLLFDGSPFYPDGNVLWDYTTAHDCTLFGTSAKYIEAMKKEGMSVRDTHDLSALKTITSTGSPLVHASFDYVYSSIKSDVHLASIYGGTDIISASFGIGNPVSPVYRGEIQGPALGTDVQIFDEKGARVIGSAGELVCVQAFPSMPVSFWKDDGDTRYHKAYFETYDNVWHHGDWVEETPHRGLIIHGRSDATLNPGGVRIGTAEIYRQVEKIDAVKDCVAVGQDFDDDVRVILFVILKSGWALDDNLVKEIKTQIRKGASPRHVPAKVIAVADIPRTKSGKITEIAVRDVIMGRVIKNVEALANPEALDLYKDLEELKS
ncbi:MAG: acetoacetate--CoA ligase [Alphaproteobacteria bacterium]